MDLKNLAQRTGVPARVSQRLGEHRTLRARVAELEAAVQENRQLNLRVAELADAMLELVVPLAERDDERVAESVTRFRESLGGPRE